MEKKLPENLVKELKKANPSLINVIKDFFGISNTIQQRFPELTMEEASELTASLMSEIAKNIEDGNSIAFIQPKKGKDVDITVYGFEAFSNSLSTEDKSMSGKKK